MQNANTVKEIPRIQIPQHKQMIVRRVRVHKSILCRLIPYLQVIGFIILVCIANGIVENL